MGHGTWDMGHGTWEMDRRFRIDTAHERLHRMKRLLSCILVLSVGVSARLQAQAQARAPYRPGIDVLDYALSVDLPDTGSVIRGDAMVTLRRLQRVDTLVLDLTSGLRVDRVRVDRRATQFARVDSSLRIPIPRS